jgi:L-alanine-DL-glutamate epimerase-like enolase superfamily enzyme
MKVSDLYLHVLSVPLERPFSHKAPRVRINPVVVRMLAKDGTEGLGLAFTWNDRQVASLKTTLEDLKETIIGQEIFRSEEAWQKLWQDTNHMGHTGYGIYALSAIDMALWDLKGKVLGMPVSRLLGGYKERVPAYASHKLFRPWSIEELQKDATALMQQGFRAMKMNLGDKLPKIEQERVRAVREAVGDEVEILIDVNWAWTVSQAIQMGHLLEPYNPYWIEDPLASDDPGELAQVARALDIPVSAGETYCTKHGFRALLEKDSADIFIVDLQRVGGVTEWMKVAAMAQAWNRPVASHLFHDFSVHLVAAAPNGLFVEYMPWWDVIYEEPLRVKDGHIEVPDKPGWGLKLDSQALKKFELK